MIRNTPETSCYDWDLIGPLALVLRVKRTGTEALLGCPVILEARVAADLKLLKRNKRLF